MPSEEDHFIPQGSIGNSSKESERTPQLDNHRMEMEPNGYPSKIGYNNDETFSERYATNMMYADAGHSKLNASYVSDF